MPAHLPFVAWMVGLGTNLWLLRARKRASTSVPAVDGPAVRIVLGLGVLDMAVRLIRMAVKVPAIIALGGGTIAMAVAVALLIVQTLGMFVRRISGRDTPPRNQLSPKSEVWRRWIVVGVLMGVLSRNGETWGHLAWFVGVYGLSLLGVWLDRSVVGQAPGLNPALPPQDR
jgi:hypothetical protein